METITAMIATRNHNPSILFFKANQDQISGSSNLWNFGGVALHQVPILHQKDADKEHSKNKWCEVSYLSSQKGHKVLGIIPMSLSFLLMGIPSRRSRNHPTILLGG
ncbi:hypothetical protein LXL04_018760 [Taraxacum kok-saghyz]